MWTLMLALWSAAAVAAEPGKDACDGKTGSEALDCIKARFPDTYATVETACADPAVTSKKTCRVERYGEAGITFVGRTPGEEAPKERSGLDHKALTGASVALTVIGATLQMVPAMCDAAKNCKLTEKDKLLISSFSGVVTEVGTVVPRILASNAPDAEKASKLISLAARLEQGLPVDLSPAAQGMIDSGLTSLRGLMPMLLSPTVTQP